MQSNNAQLAGLAIASLAARIIGISSRVGYTTCEPANWINKPGPIGERLDPEELLPESDQDAQSVYKSRMLPKTCWHIEEALRLIAKCGRFRGFRQQTPVRL